MVRVAGELCRELVARVLATREERDRPRPEGRLRGQWTNLARSALGVRPWGGPAGARGQASAATAVGAGAAIPAFSRIFASISAASSGCSFRYSRELSLPWPMRSFL